MEPDQQFGLFSCRVHNVKYTQRLFNTYLRKFDIHTLRSENVYI